MLTLADAISDLQAYTLVELAQIYARHGWYVFPIAVREKRPLAGSRGFKDATRDAMRIAAWWEQADYNIGLATGGTSGVLVVDVDQRSGGLETLPTLNLPPTLMAETGSGGRHIFYRVPPGVHLRSVNARWPGIDIKADGGYVVAPGSVHPCGGAYRWLGGTLEPIPPALVHALLLARTSDKARARSVIHRGKVRLDTMARIEAGERNQRFASLAGMLLSRGYELDDALEFCLRANAEKTDQGGGWSERELTRIVSGVFRRYACGKS